MLGVVPATAACVDSSTHRQSAEFDVFTSDELKDVMEYINHWCRHAHRRNSKKSGHHGNFEDYHLWLQEIPHLATLACSANSTGICCKQKHRCQAAH